MPKNFKRSKTSVAAIVSRPSYIWAIIKGTILAFIFTLFFVALLSLVGLISEITIIEKYSSYTMIVIVLLSIFLGSVYSTYRISSYALFIGSAVGIVYVLCSIAIGMNLSIETLNLTNAAFKLLAGTIAGAAGGFIGVNL